MEQVSVTYYYYIYYYYTDHELVVGLPSFAPLIIYRQLKFCKENALEYYYLHFNSHVSYETFIDLKLLKVRDVKNSSS